MLSKKILLSASAALLGLSLVAAPFGLQPGGQDLGTKWAYAKAGGGPGGNGGGAGNAGGNGNGNGNGGAASAGTAGPGKSGSAPGHGGQNPGKGHASDHSVSPGQSAVGKSAVDHTSKARAKSGVTTAIGRSVAKAIGKPAKATGFTHSISPALLGSLNAAHANEMALANASEKSRVGQIANYKGALETLSNPNATDQEIAEALEQAAQSLANAANKKTSPAVVGAVNDLVGVEVDEDTEVAISERANELEGD